MINRFKKVIVLLCFIFVTGCATTTKFVYNRPVPQTKNQGVLLLVYNIDDQRNSKDIDKIFKNNPLEEINQIIQEELSATGNFKQVITVPKEKMEDKDYLNSLNADLLLKGTLREFKWEVPKYKQIVRTFVIVGSLTGGIGSFIYGSTSTDVYGDTSIQITMTDIKTGKNYIDKEYKGHYKENMTKLSCDALDNRAKMAGKSLEICMSDLAKDVVSALENREKSIVRK